VRAWRGRGRAARRPTHFPRPRRCARARASAAPRNDDRRTQPGRRDGPRGAAVSGRRCSACTGWPRNQPPARALNPVGAGARGIPVGRLPVAAPRLGIEAGYAAAPHRPGGRPPPTAAAADVACCLVVGTVDSAATPAAPPPYPTGAVVAGAAAGPLSVDANPVTGGPPHRCVRDRWRPLWAGGRAGGRHATPAGAPWVAVAGRGTYCSQSQEREEGLDGDLADDRMMAWPLRPRTGWWRRQQMSPRRGGVGNRGAAKRKGTYTDKLKTRSRKYPGLVDNMRSSHRRPAHATHSPARGRASSTNKPPPTSTAAAAARAAAVTAAPSPPSHKQTNTPAPPDAHTAAGLPSHPSRSPRPRQLSGAAAAAGSPPSNSAPPSRDGASAAVRTRASGGSGDGGAMDHSPPPPPPPPPSQSPPVAVVAMPGATAASAAVGEAAVALSEPFPAPNGGGARPPSDSGGGEKSGGTAAGGAVVNAAAASAQGRRRLGPCHIARDGRCGRRRAGASGAAVRACDEEAHGRHGGHGGDTHTRARGGGWGWWPHRRGGRPRAGCVGRGRSRTNARAGGRRRLVPKSISTNGANRPTRRPRVRNVWRCHWRSKGRAKTTGVSHALKPLSTFPWKCENLETLTERG